MHINIHNYNLSILIYIVTIMLFIYLCSLIISYLFIKRIIFYINKFPNIVKQSPLTIYNQLSNMYGGKFLFNIIIRFMSPYSNSIYPTIEYYVKHYI